ncbi:MAG: ABC transporter permease [Alphaproteobacteria bacterium]
MTKTTKYYGLPFIFLSLAFLLIWQSFHYVIPILVPTPLGTLETLFRKFNLILYHLPYTVIISVGGIALSLVMAFLFAIPMQLFKSFEHAMMPWLVILQAVPFIALGPLLLAALGYGVAAKICVTALLCYFPIFLGLNEGMTQVNNAQLKTLLSLGLSQYQIMLHLRLPNALPRLFTGIRMSVSWVFSAAILSEFLGAQRGLGFLIKSASRSFDNELVFAGLIVITILSLLLFMLTKWCERKLTPWHKNI